MKPTPPNTIPWKLWLHETALKLNLFPNALRMRIERGKYPKPETVRRGRLIFVKGT